MSQAAAWRACGADREAGELLAVDLADLEAADRGELGLGPRRQWVMTPLMTPLTWVTPSLALNFSGVKVPPSVPPPAVLP